LALPKRIVDMFMMAICFLVAVLLLTVMNENEKSMLRGFGNNALIFYSRVVEEEVLTNGVVPTSSMEKTINIDDRIVASKLTYKEHLPERYDIIIFKFPDDEKELYVKRIIGLPGETVNIIGGKIYIDDRTTPLIDEYVSTLDSANLGPFFVPEGAYFVMGDNRINSFDSRYWKNPYVFFEKIQGKVIFRYFPDLGNYEEYND